MGGRARSARSASWHLQMPKSRWLGRLEAQLWPHAAQPEGPYAEGAHQHGPAGAKRVAETSDQESWPGTWAIQQCARQTGVAHHSSRG